MSVSSAGRTKRRLQLADGRLSARWTVTFTDRRDGRHESAAGMSRVRTAAVSHTWRLKYAYDNDGGFQSEEPPSCASFFSLQTSIYSSNSVVIASLKLTELQLLVDLIRCSFKMSKIGNQNCFQSRLTVGLFTLRDLPSCNHKS